MQESDYIAVIDFGSQTTKLIARRVRELGFFSKILPAHTKADLLKENMPAAIILSGGPQSMLDLKALRLDPAIFNLGLPMLGICYGMQLMMEHLGWRIERAEAREFGQRRIEIINDSLLFRDIKGPVEVWMSHFDQAIGHSPAIKTVAKSPTCVNVAIEYEEKKLYGVQFHPEVSHTKYGMDILRNFLVQGAKALPSFDLGDFLAEKIEDIKAEVSNRQVIIGLSGGIDSSVAAALIRKAIGDKLHCIYVDHGLGRLNEVSEVLELASLLGLSLCVIDAREQFLAALNMVSDPEQKRMIIGHTFIEVFEKAAQQIGEVHFLAQGTLYPDVIESSRDAGSASVAIKSHHNVGALPERMKLRLLEPLRDLFKDDVRKIGKMLGLSEPLLTRQPFPGPGLGVRIAGVITNDRLAKLRIADSIVREEIERAFTEKTLENNLWQWFAILLPVRSVGVMGDARVYGESIVIRCVESSDAMTADWAKLPPDLLARMSSRITNEVLGISRVLYDITQKPPGTIEWE